jgi:putative Holliday junction resolvase
MGVDWGEARIGVALSDPTRTLATPLTVLHTKDRREQVEAVAALAREHDVGLLVVGLPYELDGTLGASAHRAGKYADKLAQVTGLPVARIDERLTSVQATSIIAANRALGGAHRRRGRAAKGEVDKVAAAIILQDWLDQAG